MIVKNQLYILQFAIIELNFSLKLILNPISNDIQF